MIRWNWIKFPNQSRWILALETLTWVSLYLHLSCLAHTVIFVRHTSKTVWAFGSLCVWCNCCVYGVCCCRCWTEQHERKKKKSHTPNSCTHKFIACHRFGRTFIFFFLLFLVGSILVFPAKIDLDSDMSLMWWQLWQQHYYACCATFFFARLVALALFVFLFLSLSSCLYLSISCCVCVLKSKNIRWLQPHWCLSWTCKTKTMRAQRQQDNDTRIKSNQTKTK